MWLIKKPIGEQRLHYSKAAAAQIAEVKSVCIPQTRAILCLMRLNFLSVSVLDYRLFVGTDELGEQPIQIDLRSLHNG